MYSNGQNPLNTSTVTTEYSKTNVNKHTVGNSTIYQVLINAQMPIMRSYFALDKMINDKQYDINRSAIRKQIEIVIDVQITKSSGLLIKMI